jgi:hypothetical protein
MLNNKNKIYDFVSHDVFLSCINDKIICYRIDNNKEFVRLFFKQCTIWINRLLLFLLIFPFVFITTLAFKFNHFTLLIGLVGIYPGVIIHKINTKSSNQLKNFIETSLCFVFLLITLVYYFGIDNIWILSFGCLTVYYVILEFGNYHFDSNANKILMHSQSSYNLAIENKIISLHYIV